MSLVVFLLFIIYIINGFKFTTRRNGPYRPPRWKQQLTDECQYFKSSINYPKSSEFHVTYPINSCMINKDDRGQIYSLKYVCSQFRPFLYLEKFYTSNCTGHSNYAAIWFDSRYSSTEWNCNDEDPICQYASIKFHDNYNCNTADSTNNTEYRTIKQVTDYCISAEQWWDRTYFMVECIRGSVIIKKYYNDDECSDPNNLMQTTVLNQNTCYDENVDVLNINGYIDEIKCYDIDDKLIEYPENCNLTETQYILTPNSSLLLNVNRDVYVEGPCYDDPIFNETNVNWFCQFGSIKTELNIINDTIAKCSIPGNFNADDVVFGLVSSKNQFYPYLPLTTFKYMIDGEFKVSPHILSCITNNTNISITWNTDLTDANVVSFTLLEIVQLIIPMPNDNGFPVLRFVKTLQVNTSNDGESTTALTFNSNDFINEIPLVLISMRVNDEEQYYSNLFTICVNNNATELCLSWSKTDETNNGDILPKTPCPDIYPESVQIESRGTCKDTNFEKDSCQNGNDYCVFNDGAYNCLRSPKDGQQCCYRKNNTLCTDGLCPGSSRLLDSKHHYSLYFDYINNLEPKLLCCIKSDNCDVYYERRPKSIGKRTRALIRCTAIRGDPWFITLDGHEYAFNGIGDYYLLLNRHISIITRLKKVNCGSVNHGLLIYDKDDDVSYEIIIRHDSVDDSVELRLFYNQHPVIFNNNTAYNSDNYKIYYVTNFMQLNLIRLGINIEILLRVVDDVHYLDYVFVIDEMYKNNVQGLLGNFDGDKTNDFKKRNVNSEYNFDTLTDDILYQFGLSWIVTQSDREYYMFFEETFYEDNEINQWNPINVNGLLECNINGTINDSIDVNSICGDDDSCKLDILATGIIELGNLTKTFGNIIKKSIQELTEQFTTTVTPTNIPTDNPSNIPSKKPTMIPSNQPSNNPTTNPTMIPSNQPSNTPTKAPTQTPSNPPTDAPTVIPTMIPTKDPTDNPSMEPTFTPTIFTIQQGAQQNRNNELLKLILILILVPCTIILICLIVYFGCKNRLMNKSKNYASVKSLNNVNIDIIDDVNNNTSKDPMINNDQITTTNMTSIGNIYHETNDDINNGINDKHDNDDSDNYINNIISGGANTTTPGYNQIDYDVYNEGPR